MVVVARPVMLRLTSVGDAPASVVFVVVTPPSSLRSKTVSVGRGEDMFSFTLTIKSICVIVCKLGSIDALRVAPVVVILVGVVVVTVGVDANSYVVNEKISPSYRTEAETATTRK